LARYIAVGVLDQRIRGLGVTGVHADPDRGGDLKRAAIEGEGLPQPTLELLGVGQRPLGGDQRIVLEAFAEHQELIPAVARQHASRLIDAAQTIADELEQVIPGGMAEGVVDELESVEVDEQQPDRAAACAGMGQGRAYAVAQRGPVGQPGERVLEGETVQGLVGKSPRRPPRLHRRERLEAGGADERLGHECGCQMGDLPV